MPRAPTNPLLQVYCTAKGSLRQQPLKQRGLCPHRETRIGQSPAMRQGRQGRGNGRLLQARGSKRLLLPPLPGVRLSGEGVLITSHAAKQRGLRGKTITTTPTRVWAGNRVRQMLGHLGKQQQQQLLSQCVKWCHLRARQRVERRRVVGAV